MRTFVAAWVLVAMHAGVARADASVSTLEHGSWPDSVAALQSDLRSLGTTLSVCVRDDGEEQCAPCGSYTLSFDEAGRRAFAVGACDGASGTTRVSLVDRSALFEEGHVVPRPRAITIEAAVVRHLAASGGAASMGGSTVGCTAQVRPFLRDLEHGGVVALGPDRFRIAVQHAAIAVSASDGGWVLSSDVRIASDVDYDVVERASGEIVLHGHASLACESETLTASSTVTATPPPRRIPPASAMPPTDYAATQSCSAVALAPGNVLTNVPSVAYVNHGSPDLVLVSSDFISHPTSMTWVGEIRNDSHATVCPEMYLGVDGRDLARAPVAADQHELRAMPGWTFPCIEPGHVGVAYQFYPDVTIGDVVRWGTVHYEVRVAAGMTPHRRADPAAPVVSSTRASHHTTGGDDSYVAHGTVRVSSVRVENVEIDVFPRDPCGLLGDSISAFPIVQPSASVAFTTLSGAPFDFTRSLAFASYVRSPAAPGGETPRP